MTYNRYTSIALNVVLLEALGSINLEVCTCLPMLTSSYMASTGYTYINMEYATILLIHNVQYLADIANNLLLFGYV